MNVLYAGPCRCGRHLSCLLSRASNCDTPHAWIRCSDCDHVIEATKQDYGDQPERQP